MNVDNSQFTNQSKEDDKELNQIIKDIAQSEQQLNSQQSLQYKRSITFYDALKTMQSESVVSIRKWATNFMQQTHQMSPDQMDKFFNVIHYKILQRKEMLNQLNNLFVHESQLLNMSTQNQSVHGLQQQQLMNTQDLDSKTETIYFDNENYENTIIRLRNENVIAQDRLVELREMIKKYDKSSIKWLNVCRESEITNNETTLQAATFNHSVNLEKKDQLAKIQQRKNYLQQLDQMINEYDKELELLKEQEIDVQGRCFLLKRRLQYLKQRSLEFSKKQGYWNEKLHYIMQKFHKLQQRFKYSKINNFHQLQDVLIDKVIPKNIEKQSLENQAKDYLQRIMSMQQTRGELLKQLNELKQNNQLKQENQGILQQPRKLQDYVDQNNIRNQQIQTMQQKQQAKINHVHMTLLQLREKIYMKISKQQQQIYENQYQEFAQIIQQPIQTDVIKFNYQEVIQQTMQFERTVQQLLQNITITLPRLDQNMRFLEILPENQRCKIQVITISKQHNKNDDSQMFSREFNDSFDQQEEDTLRIYKGLSLDYNNLELIYHDFFGDKPLLHMEKQARVQLRRKKTLRSIGMEMMKKQAHILINSKKSSDFEVYFHTMRQTDKMRKEMQSEIKQIQKEKKDAKLQDVFEEALIQKIEKLQQKEIIKQEQEAQNVLRMSQQLKNLFSNNQKIEQNTFIKKKWEAQNLLQYRKVEEKYRSLKQKLDKPKVKGIKNDNFEQNLTIQAQKIQQKQFLNKVKNLKQQDSHTQIETMSITSLQKIEPNHKSLYSSDSTTKTNRFQNIQSFHNKTNSSPFLQLINNPSQANLVNKTQTPNKLLQNTNQSERQFYLIQSNKADQTQNLNQQDTLSKSNTSKQISFNSPYSTNQPTILASQNRIIKKSESAQKFILPKIKQSSTKQSDRLLHINQQTDESELTLKSNTLNNIQTQRGNPYLQKSDLTSSGIIQPLGPLTTRSRSNIKNLDQPMLKVHTRTISHINFPNNNYHNNSSSQDGKLLYKVMVKESKRSIVDNIISKQQQLKNQKLQSSKQNQDALVNNLIIKDN